MCIICAVYQEVDLFGSHVDYFDLYALCLHVNVCVVEEQLRNPITKQEKQERWTHNNKHACCQCGVQINHLGRVGKGRKEGHDTSAWLPTWGWRWDLEGYLRCGHWRLTTVCGNTLWVCDKYSRDGRAAFNRAKPPHLSFNILTLTPMGLHIEPLTYSLSHQWADLLTVCPTSLAIFHSVTHRLGHIQ